MSIQKVDRTINCNFCNKEISDLIECEQKTYGNDLNEIRVTNKLDIQELDKTQLPDSGVSFNKDFDEASSIKSKNLDGDYIKARDSIDSLATKIRELNILINDPEYFLHEYFLDIRNKIDKEREEFKAKIDDHYLQLIEKINDIENSLKPLERLNDNFHKEVTSFEKRLFHLNSELDQCLEKDWEKVEFEAKFQQLKLEQIKNNLKNELLEYKSYSFLNSYLNFSNIKQLQTEVTKKVQLPKIGNFEFKLCNFSRFTESVSVHKDRLFIFNNTRWILRYQNKDGKYLGCRLQFLPNINSFESLEYSFSFRLVNFLNPSRICEHKFKQKERNSGEFKGKDCSSFQDIKENGFYDSENDSVHLIVKIELP